MGAKRIAQAAARSNSPVLLWPDKERHRSKAIAINLKTTDVGHAEPRDMSVERVLVRPRDQRHANLEPSRQLSFLLLEQAAQQALAPVCAVYTHRTVRVGPVGIEQSTLKAQAIVG